MSNQEITPESSEPLEKNIRQHLAAGKHAKVPFERPVMTRANGRVDRGISCDAHAARPRA